MAPALLASPIVLRPPGVRAGAALLLAGGAVRPLLPVGTALACPLRALTGIPCPLCGLTTSVTDAVHLRLADAATATPAGVVLVVLALVALVARRREETVVAAWVPISAAAGMWAYQLGLAFLA